MDLDQHTDHPGTWAEADLQILGVGEHGSPVHWRQDKKSRHDVADDNPHPPDGENRNAVGIADAAQGNDVTGIHRRGKHGDSDDPEGEATSTQKPVDVGPGLAGSQKTIAEDRKVDTNNNGPIKQGHFNSLELARALLATGGQT